ncbi:unnamed protein product [Closterium sp. Naga37s-1]|nr:unnamed protein product [Closterium sp. Naga37s-1]
MCTVCLLCLSPTLGGEVWRAGLGAGEGVVTRSLWGGGAALEQSVWRTARAARAGGQQGVQCCRGRVRGAGEAGQGRRGLGREGAGILLSPVPPLYPTTLLPPALLPYSVPSFPHSRPPLPLPSSLPPSLCLTTLFTLSVARPPFLPSSISLPPYPLYPLCCPSSLPPILLSCHSSSPHPPSIQSPFPFPSPTLPPPSSRQPCSSVPPFYLPPCTEPHFFLSSAHHLIRPSSHPPIISSAHHLIRPSSHPPILSSAHHLIRPSSHRRPRFCLSAFPCSLSPTHASSRSPFRPSSVSPLLIFCLRAFFVPHPPSEFVVRVCAGLPCIQF